MKQIAKIACLLLGLAISSPFMKAESKKNMNIVFIGNSITQGALIATPSHDAPPVKAALYLTKQPSVASVKYSNQGVSGCTTTDYLPTTETLFPKAKAAADKFADETWATLIFSIMLGTNDSAITGPNGAPASPEKYEENMKAIINQLLALYPSCKIVLHRPVWYSPNTYNGAMYLKEGLNRLQSYYPVLQSLVEEYAKRFPGQVFMGDTEAFDYFKANYLTDLIPEEGNAGTFYLHPNEKGAAVLGEYWGKAIMKVVE
ncbi:MULTISPECIES: GDSL-type esterase/lipase family protein [Parabacteroides]|uniref:GDSL-type esterase/lipase family protein n=1 Tax=Parabacteroides TaxID=375288 RepID=UPI00351A86EC